MDEIVQVVTAASSREEADRLAQVLVGERLAACVQVLGPISSTYHWQGRVESGQEFLCIAKTLQSLFPRLEACLRLHHSYEVPEILAFKATGVGQDYAHWLRSELAEPENS